MTSTTRSCAFDVAEWTEWIGGQMAACGVPGLSLAVVVDGQPTSAAGFGVTAVEGGQPVTADTLFRIASVTKVITTIALLRLVEEGILDLDRPARQYVPDLRLRRQENTEGVTLRTLLSHTSGLPEGAIERPWRTERRAPDGLAAFVREDLPRFPLIGAPGQLYFYSNVGFNLAGYAAEAVTGVRFERLLADLVLGPLGLERTTLDPTVAMTYPLAQRHQADPTGVVRVRHDGGDDVAFYPSGYAFSTAADMARVLRLLLVRGEVAGQRILTEDSVRMMQTPHADVRLGRGLHYGLASLIEPDYKGIRRVGHEGVLRGYCAKITYAPERGVGVVLLYNHEYNERPRFFAARERIVDRVFDELLGLPPGPVRPAAGPVPAGVPQRVAGRYAPAFGPATAELRACGAELWLRYVDRDLPLRAVDPHTYIGPPTDEDLGSLPWPRTPYVIDNHVTVGVPAVSSGCGDLITINGQPYWRVAGS